MPETLVVHLNRDGRRDLEVPNSFEAAGPFEVDLVNHGPATHVYLGLDDTLAEVARIDEPNPYVETDATRRVIVGVEPLQERVQGELSVATGYGAEEHDVSVHLLSPASGSVEVDEDLATPGSDSEPIGSGGGAPDYLAALPVVVLGAVAVILAIGAVQLADGPGILLGALAVLAGVLAAAYILVG